MRPQKKYSRQEALSKLMKYCAYQDRCHAEVEKKLYDWGFYDEDSRASIIYDLMKHDFLNEERFAYAFVKGKFELKKWGKVKIAYELRNKKISDNLIRLALKQIDDAVYRDTLRELLLKKSKQIGENNRFKRNQKLAQYAYQKGYEQDLIRELLDEQK